MATLTHRHVRSNIRIQATAGDMRPAIIDGAVSPAAPDPERSATMSSSH